MNCANCNSAQHRVVATTERPDSIERRRECVTCGHRWKTVEAHAARFELSSQIAEAGQRFAYLLGQMGIDGGE